jgi:FkbM family methyltransferase
VPEAFARLEAWSKTQHGRVTPVNCAIGDVQGSFNLIKHDLHTSSSSFLKTTPQCQELYPETGAKSTITVGCETLDAAVARLPKPLHREILIKLDVQGYEAHVIDAGRQTFLAASAAIIEVSLVSLYESQPTFADIVNRMDQLEFDYAGSLDQVCNADGRLLSIDAVFFRRM